MGPTTVHSAGEAWALAARQHGVVSRAQLLALGLSPAAVTHRLECRRLHPTPWRGVYAVGRPQLTRRGVWMAAVLSCGPGALLSHRSAAACWGVVAARQERGQRAGGIEAMPSGLTEHRPSLSERPQVGIDVSVPASRCPRRAGVVVHRRQLGPERVTALDGIPLTAPVQTLVDLATCASRIDLEAAVNAADRLDLIDPERLRTELGEHGCERGVAVLRELLDRRTFALTDSQLERRFLPIARAAGLPMPLTQQHLRGARVDFYWPALGLVVETDGLRYHRTPAQQAADRIRDQAHAAAGLTPLRFTHAQVAFDAAHVRTTLARVARRLAATPKQPTERFGGP